MTSPFSRRRFLRQGSFLTTAAAAPAWLRAAQPWNRESFHITGLSLAAYSMRPFLKWLKGKEQEGDMDLFGFLDYCAELGISGAELTAYFFPPDADAAYCHRLKRRAQVLGLDVTGGAIGNRFSHVPGSPEAEEQHAYVTRWIDLYAELGAPVIRVFAGRPGKGQTIEETLVNIRENLSRALEHAEKRGVMLAVENHDFTSDVDRFVQVMGLVDSPWLGATLDTANLRGDLDPYAQLERIAPYALTAQVKVAMKTPEGKVPTDYARVVGILKKHRYRGYLVLEYEEKENHEEEIPRHLAELAEHVARA